MDTCDLDIEILGYLFVVIGVATELGALSRQVLNSLASSTFGEHVSKVQFPLKYTVLNFQVHLSSPPCIGES